MVLTEAGESSVDCSLPRAIARGSGICRATVDRSGDGRGGHRVAERQPRQRWTPMGSALDSPEAPAFRHARLVA